ncbi:hypothetical protein [Pseudofrankia inefficax]|uniref:hypothetical protein n=1 Tax=Pseudofrankia inefficax (strain DSM 45817 / CECT 9037 / DDB 130130 / EuI1c) TaxID=298654 RepID=UPI001E357EC2|nr:hypothetical protein [Pseudofrankia inefficax]
MTATVQPPDAALVVTGGNGNSLTEIGSGFGAGGLLTTSGSALIPEGAAPVVPAEPDDEHAATATISAITKPSTDQRARVADAGGRRRPPGTFRQEARGNRDAPREIVKRKGTFSSFVEQP